MRRQPSVKHLTYLQTKRSETDPVSVRPSVLRYWFQSGFQKIFPLVIILVIIKEASPLVSMLVEC